MRKSEDWRGGFSVKRRHSRRYTTLTIALRTGPKGPQQVETPRTTPNPPGNPNTRRIAFLDGSPTSQPFVEKELSRWNHDYCARWNK